MNKTFQTRDQYRVFIKGCRLFLKDAVDRGNCPFSEAVDMMRKELKFNDPEDCHIYCGNIFPELNENPYILEGECPCGILFDDVNHPRLDPKDKLLQNLIKERVSDALEDRYWEYISHYR